jgi:hypothetical protein
VNLEEEEEGPVLGGRGGNEGGDTGRRGGGQGRGETKRESSWLSIVGWKSREYGVLRIALR